MRLLTASLILGFLLSAATAQAQSSPPPANTQAATPLKVFLDCDRCDSDYLKRNVTFVDYVLNRDVADVHVLVTTQGTGGAEAAPTPTKDRWNYWVFEVGGGGRMNGQSLNTSSSYYGQVSASRTTEAWKINISASRNENQSEFTLDPETTIVSRQSSWSVNSLVVKSLGPRWSLGGRAGGSHSSYSNEDRALTAMPGIEFDVFPYSESSERSLTFQYNIGPTYYRYVEETIYDKLSEIVPSHSFNVSLGLRQPWGSVGASANFSQHLNHTDRYRIGVVGSADVRIFKGFSFNVFGEYSKIADQIGLPKSFLSTEDILLQTRQRPTDHSYFFSVGLSYRFGSIFNSTVNPRFGGSHD